MDVNQENIVEVLLQVKREQSLPFSIEVLNLSSRVRHSLLRNGINTIDRVVDNWSALLKINNMGIYSVHEITKKILIWYQNMEVLSLAGIAANNQHVDGKLGIDQLDMKPPCESQFLITSIEELHLSKRAYAMLKRKGINNIGQIYAEWENIDSYKYVSSSSLDQIQLAIRLFRAFNEPRLATARETSVDKKQQSASIIELDITRRVYSLLKQNNIYTIDQITHSKLEELNSSKILGSLTITQIKSAIILWSRREGVEHELLKETISEILQTSMSIDDYVIGLLEVLSPREKSIIEIKYGLITGNIATFQETADHFEVTCERVRQIERAALIKIRHQLHELGYSPLFERINEYVIDRGGLIADTRLKEQLNRNHTKTVYQNASVLDFLRCKFGGRDGKFNKSGSAPRYILELQGWSTEVWSTEQILHASKKILELLSTSIYPKQWADLYSELIHEDGLITLDENLAHAITLCLSDIQQIIRQLDGGWVKNGKLSRSSRIISALRQIGRPAHFSEITEFYNQTIIDLPLSTHNIHSVLSSHDEFVRVGQGKYGLSEWGLHDDGNVSNAVRRILVDNKSPMFLVDIINEVLKTWDVQNSAVISAIESDARFSKTEDGKIWLTETGLTLKKRVKRDDDTRWDRLLIVLRKLGKPFQTHLIVEAHNNSYPERPLTVSAVKHMMYRKPELFVRTGRDEFGLTEWGVQPFQDTPVDRSEEILKILRQKSPIHINELHNLYNENHPEKQVSLVTIGLDLKNLAGRISSPRRGIYKIIDEVEIETTPSHHD